MCRGHATRGTASLGGTLQLPKLAGNMQSAVDEKKKAELRLDNVNGELTKLKAQVAELEGTKQQLQVLLWIPQIRYQVYVPAGLAPWGGDL